MSYIVVNIQRIALNSILADDEKANAMQIKLSDTGKGIDKGMLDDEEQPVRMLQQMLDRFDHFYFDG